MQQEHPTGLGRCPGSPELGAGWEVVEAESCCLVFLTTTTTSPARGSVGNAAAIWLSRTQLSPPHPERLCPRRVPSEQVRPRLRPRLRLRPPQLPVQRQERAVPLPPRVHGPDLPAR